MKNAVTARMREKLGRIRLVCAFAAITLLIAGCGGGGGGGGGSGSGGTSINLPPVAANSCSPIFDDPPSTITSVAVNLTATDPNGSGTIASYTIDTLPANGSIDGCPAPSCTLSTSVATYVPKSNSTGRRGMDKFTFHVTDSGGLPSSTATAWILNSGKVRIMPLGDSITQGVLGGSSSCSNPDPVDGNCPARADRVAYRMKLFSDLTTNPLTTPHFPVQFVGGLADGSNQLTSQNDKHEGHPGDCVGPTPGNAGSWCRMGDLYKVSIQRNISSNIANWLDTSPPDIILLHAGTNDLSTDNTTGNTDANTLLNNISSWAQANYPVTAFVARIIPARGGTLNVDAFNNSVQTTATLSRTSLTVPPMVDQQAQFWINNGSTLTDKNTADPALISSADTGGFHPNQTGYDKMADKWYADLVASGILPSCQ